MTMRPDPLSANFDEHGRYVLRSYDQAPPFSSFLPGIAGLYGIPLWVFTTNRGQAVSSFGVESKDRPILEFQPANKAYQLTGTLGFRTFLRSAHGLVEPFSPWSGREVQRDLFVGMNELEIRETDPGLGLETRVTYFTLTDAACAGLVRRVQFRNLGDAPLAFEVLDGLPALMPYGVDNGLLKHIGRTIEAWMEVFHLETRRPFFRLRASAEDTSDIRAIEAGNFALAISDGRLLPAFVDPAAVFGADTAFSRPQAWLAQGLAGLADARQVTEGRTPCALFGERLSLAPGAQGGFASVFGFAQDWSRLQDLSDDLARPGAIDEGLARARRLAVQLTDPIATRSGDDRFDAYCRQTLLDNLMRGGWPQVLGGRHVYHVFSRKHGDPERDYNHFFLAAEPFSQGNGNFRDVNQNRRSDVLFEPRSGDFAIRLFVSLIQLDGYNPLVVQGTAFTLPAAAQAGPLALVERPQALRALLAGSFTPGQLLETAGGCGLRVSPADFLEQVLGAAEQHIQAEFGEGYWIDHWTYSLDLIDAYLAIYPDRKAALLFDSPPLPFYDSPEVVRPRARKYVLDHGQPRQFGAIGLDEEKAALLAARASERHWARAEFGQGPVFRLPLISKLALLAVIKFATRDPFGMGLEMEAGRPGWYDALNGLPGIFGASMPESFELLRLLDLLLEAFADDARACDLPVEAEALLQAILQAMAQPLSDFDYWDAVSTARERYREQTRLGVSGRVQAIPAAAMRSALGQMRARVQAGIEAAIALGGGLTPTYFACQVSDYAPTGDFDPQGRELIRPLAFTRSVLPIFLEGPVHQMKVLGAGTAAADLHARVRGSDLFDPELGMYKLNASLLDQPHSIGRARAFSRGWLENESIWMHMSFKYLLEMLKAGLYQPFFADMRAGMPPFLDERIYGRSPLENSSFIVSSAHPDPALHGRGFVARLTGATAEFLSIWFVMMTGGAPFACAEDGSLLLRLQPKLPGWLFPEDGILEFCFLGHTRVRIHNPARQDTWNLQPEGARLETPEGVVDVRGPVIPAPLAERLRAGEIGQVDLYFSSTKA